MLAQATMFTDGRAPGDLGFDPLNLSADESALRRYELAELKHSRLAMIAIGGFVHQVYLLHTRYYIVYLVKHTKSILLFLTWGF